MQKRSEINYADIKPFLSIQNRSEINFAEIRQFLQHLEEK
jgi:hypothetical protein